MIKHLFRLHTNIRDAGVAIDGVDGNGVISPANLQASAQPIIAAFDDSDAAQAAWEKATKDASEPDIAMLRDQATQAIADINTFLAVANPNNAAVVAEVRAIDQRQRAVIKALLRLALRVV